MLPGILNQLGAESLTHLKRLASNVGGAGVGGAMEAANNMEEEDDEGKHISYTLTLLL